MGLSNGERLTGLLFTVKRITELGRELPVEDYEFKTNHLKQLISELWYNVFKNNTNNSLWIFGNSADAVIKENNTDAWSTIIKGGIGDDVFNRNNVEIISRKNYHFDATELLSLTSLINNVKPTLARIVKIFLEVETIIYYLKRYSQDEFHNTYIDLDKLICSIYGECFSIMTESPNDEIITKASILNKICEILYEGTYPYHQETWTFLVRMLVKYNIHHNLGSVMNDDEITIKTLATTHSRLILIRDNNGHNSKVVVDQVNKLIETLRLIGHHFHYVHIHNELLGNLPDEFLPYIDEIRSTLKRCRSLYKKNSRKNRNSDPSHIELNLAQYGIYDKEDLIEKRINLLIKEKPEQKKEDVKNGTRRSKKDSRNRR